MAAEVENSNPPSNVKDAGYEPMLTILGTSTHQTVTIENTPNNFMSGIPPWSTVLGTYVYDPLPVGTHDADYALQCAPYLLNGGKVIDERYSWARTTVGVGYGLVYIAVSDAEGLSGGQGTSGNQMGHFYRDTLHATTAMTFDGGSSSEMVLTGVLGPRLLNTVANEHAYYDYGYPANLAYPFTGWSPDLLARAKAIVWIDSGRSA